MGYSFDLKLLINNQNSYNCYTIHLSYLPFLNVKTPLLYLHLQTLSWRASAEKDIQTVCLPERGLEDLSGGALFGVVVVPVEKVSKHSLVGRDVRCLPTVDPLGAGLRHRQARPPIWPSLVVVDAPRATFKSFNWFNISFSPSFLPLNCEVSFS